MASHAYVTTPVREQALAALVDEANGDLVNPPAVPWTASSYFRAHLDGTFDAWARAKQQALAVRCVVAFQTAPADARAQVLAMLGMSAYAGLPAADLAVALQQVGLNAFVKLTADQQNQAFVLVGLTA